MAVLTVILTTMCFTVQVSTTDWWVSDTEIQKAPTCCPTITNITIAKDPADTAVQEEDDDSQDNEIINKPIGVQGLFQLLLKVNLFNAGIIITFRENY